MSPVLGAGSVGYDDYQRIANYDSPILYSFHAPPSNSTLNSSVIPVLRWTYLAGIITPNTNPSNLVFTWTSDALGLSTVGVQNINVANLITGAFQFRLLNLAPYVQVSQGPIGGLNWGADGAMYGSNRDSPLFVIPRNPVIFNQQNVLIAASTGVNVYPIDYFAGRIATVASFTSVNQFAQLEVLSAANTWDILGQIGPPAAAGAILQQDFTLGIGAFRWFVANNDVGAQHYTLTNTPVLTG